jgi:hypothetical protein
MVISKRYQCVGATIAALATLSGAGRVMTRWADLSHFKPEHARVRQAAGEEVWWYFLWKYRIKG